MWLLGAIALSMALHCFILYVPPAAAMFSVTALNASEWLAVLWLSFPVILVDEVLKYITRCATCACAALYCMPYLIGVTLGRACKCRLCKRTGPSRLLARSLPCMNAIQQHVSMLVYLRI